MSARTQYILFSTLTIVALSVLIVVLVATLSVPPLENGGSPDWPPPPAASWKDQSNKDTHIHTKIELEETEEIFAPEEKKLDKDEVQVTTENPDEKSPLGQYRYAAVTADAVPCSTVGTNILAQKQGSAVDAAIATMICVGVVNCHTSGIGGGHFMTIYDTPNDGSTEKIFNTILARERAPLNASRDMYINASYSSSKGGMSIAVPGEVKGFYRAWQKFGRVSWNELYEPSIELCTTGYPVTEALSDAIRIYENDIRADPSLSELFVKEDGSLVQEGDILYRPKLARTLRIIADDPEAFYNPDSQLAQDIIADIEDYDGIITLEDLEVYEVYDKDPLEVNLDNGQYTVIGPRPPSSGVVFQYILNILDGYNFNEDSISDTEQKILTYHRTMEAFKFAYAKRSKLGDEDFVEGIDELLQNLTSSAYADSIRSKINDSYTQDVMYYEPDFDLFVDSGTAHANVIAADGAAVAITSTINLYFGSNVRGNRTGIFFNDEMDDFSTPGTSNDFGVPASPSNYIVPYKMPMSSMCPAILIDSDGVVRFLSGASGGTRITTATAYVTMHSLWFGMQVNEATDEKRIHHQLMPNQVEYEPGYDQTILDGLAAKAHETNVRSSIGTVQSIHNTCTGDSGTEACIDATCDVRKGGQPDGY